MNRFLKIAFNNIVARTNVFMRFVFRYFGFEALLSKFTGKQTNAPTGMLWLFSAYVALYGWTEQRERNFWENIKPAMKSVREQTLSEETRLLASAYIKDGTLTQDQWCEVWEWGLFPIESYLEPDFFNPATVILSLSDKTYPMVDPADPIDMGLMMRVQDVFEDWGAQFPNEFRAPQLPANQGLNSDAIRNQFFDKYGDDREKMSNVCGKRLLNFDWEYPTEQTEFYICRQLVSEIMCLGNGVPES